MTRAHKTAEEMRQRAAAAAVMADPRWARVVARDAGADGGFVFAVTTTGVYCRPSCSARRARPEHLRFFGAAAEAEEAGFRACRRCVPDGASVRERQAAAMAEVCRRMERAIAEGGAKGEVGLDELAKGAGMSRFHFQRIFRAAVGVTPKAYMAGRRRDAVREGLASAGTVTEAIYGAGYGSGGRFYAEADGVLGMTPTAFRAGGAEAEIWFAVGASALGAVLVAMSERGVCAILLGEDAGELVRDLQVRFPRAALAGGDAAFEAYVAEVVGFVERPEVGLGLPLDIRGTVFQQRVWQALREVPVGTTASYAEVAARLGLVGGARAVAGACAANALAVAIPCHRVVRSDGGLAGYRWGVERKRELLRREAAAAAES